MRRRHRPIPRRVKTRRSRPDPSDRGGLTTIKTGGGYLPKRWTSTRAGAHQGERVPVKTVGKAGLTWKSLIETLKVRKRGRNRLDQGGPPSPLPPLAKGAWVRGGTGGSTLGVGGRVARSPDRSIRRTPRKTTQMEFEESASTRGCVRPHPSGRLTDTKRAPKIANEKCFQEKASRQQKSTSGELRGNSPKFGTLERMLGVYKEGQSQRGGEG